jgi:hypothetical protein
MERSIGPRNTEIGLKYGGHYYSEGVGIDDGEYYKSWPSKSYGTTQPPFEFK